MATIVETPSSFDSYKYQWARYLARKNLDVKTSLLERKVAENVNLPRFENLAQLAVQLSDQIKGDVPSTTDPIKIGIIGAGCAGLFTAMILEYINKYVKGVKFEYDIHEAAGPKRLGGRLFTHYFSESKHDYYDVGAMRFPNNDIMKRTFQLFKLIGIDCSILDGSVDNTKETEAPKLIRYYLDDDLKVCPSYYNDVQFIGPPPAGKDPYKVNEGLPKNDLVREDLLGKSPGKVVDDVIEDFTNAFKNVLDGKRDSKEETENTTTPEDGWNLLMSADQLSTRQFFRSTNIEGIKNVKGPGFNFNTIEWLETFAYATGWYNQSLSETVLEALDFDDQHKGKAWYCIEGGTQQVATMMNKMIAKKPTFNSEVTSIKAKQNKRMVINVKKTENGVISNEQHEYYAVLNSTTLAALQRMDIKDAGLRYGTKQAIRSLGYGASCKVGMKFKTGWWMKEPHNIKKGSLSKTDLPLRVCVYPSYNLNDADGECVLLCSYTWAQDAQRIGSLILPDTPNKKPEDEEELKTTLFHNLAVLHATPSKPYEEMLAFIKEQYITHHSYDWYADQNMSGAFAYFGPGQFSSMWPEIIEPNGHLILIGEAASAHHAWIVGALESAVRGVYQMLEMLHLSNPSYQPYKDAMNLLADPSEKQIKEDLPFYPLPREIPKRQLGTSKDTDVVTLPKDAADKTAENAADLSFMAAQVILGLVESFVEQAEQK